MKRGRSGRSLLLVLFVAGAAVAYRKFGRQWMKNWGATPEEVYRPLPGDDIILEADNMSTIAITFDAPASAIWPWLVQMGCQRAGWYSYDLLDNGGKASAEEIMLAFQQLEEGDILLSTPDGEVGFPVHRIEPERMLALGRVVEVESGEPLQVRGINTNVSWVFVLEPVDERSTRMLVRTRSIAGQTPIGRLADNAWDIVHFIMQRRQLLNLKARVESISAKNEWTRDLSNVHADG